MSQASVADLTTRQTEVPAVGAEAKKGSPRPADRLTDHDSIARLAYQRFEMRGCTHGLDQEDWYEAERELKGRGTE